MFNTSTTESSSNSSSGISEIQYEPLCRWFSLAEIQSATNNFDEKSIIGIGGFGKVYKGFIDGGATAVAVKRLNSESNQGAQEFWMEVKMLSNLRHAHLVALIGSCNEGQEMILVYEYIPNGTLAHHLHKGRTRGASYDTTLLTWEQRLNICVGAARGLDYLHTGTDKSFIHRDVKTTNILLDEQWLAKISDFGLSKDTVTQSQTHVTTAVKGTFGYLDPDYFVTQRLTKKSDVYAFGVVMLEVVCGRPAVDTRLEEEQIGLVFWVKNCIQKGTLYHAIDPSLRGQISPASLKCFVDVACNCLHDRPAGRPTMAQVAAGLEHAMALQRGGTGTENTNDHRLVPAKNKRHRSFIKNWIQSFQDALPNTIDFHVGSLQLDASSYDAATPSTGEFPARGNRPPDRRNT